MAESNLHGLRHHSASSLKAYAAQPALWVMERLLGHKSPKSALMVRGLATEEGAHFALTNPDADLDDALAVAWTRYDRDMAFSTDPRRDSERALVEGYLKHAVEALRPYGVPSSVQDRIEIRLEGVTLPLIGYTDFTFDQHGVVVDLKTTDKLPTSIKPSDALGQAAYQRAKPNYQMHVVYVRHKPTKTGDKAIAAYEMTPDEARYHLHALTEIAKRLERFLSLSDDPQELARLVVPDYGHFYWSNPQTREAGRAVFGF